MELILSFLTGLLLGIVAAYIAFIKLTQNSRDALDIIKGGAKTRGDWGEMVLERILEASGLQKGMHYLCQESYENEETGRLRPDFVICLPDNRQVVIDAKASFDKNRVKEHVKSLKARFYEQIKGLNTPDFVIMFIPVESVFIEVMRSDAGLFEFAWKNKILITGPSTLLVALKTVELAWQRENQSKNVVEIAEESGKLYDRFVGLVGDIETVKGQFNKVLVCFEDMNRKLEGQKGLIQQAEKIRELGAKTSKSLPERN